MKHALANSLRRLWAAIPQSKTLFKLCRMYVNHYTGDNNADMRTNGELRALSRLLPRCHVAFDVGANVGEWAGHALRINPNLQIHCFEPASTTYATLLARSRDLPPGHVIANQMALSHEPGQAQLFLHGDAHDVNSLHPGATTSIAAETGAETVRLETLDRYCRDRGIDRIGYLKIDVEGHELGVLRGAAEMLSRRAIDFVQVEYSPGYLAAGAKFADVFRLLTSDPAAYRCHKILPRGIDPRPEYSTAQETFALSNWLFVRPGVDV
jgi:FkbM family methyltransferase